MTNDGDPRNWNRMDERETDPDRLDCDCCGVALTDDNVGYRAPDGAFCTDCEARAAAKEVA